MDYFGTIEVFVPSAQVFFAGAGIEDEESGKKSKEFTPVGAGMYS